MKKLESRFSVNIVFLILSNTIFIFSSMWNGFFSGRFFFFDFLCWICLTKFFREFLFTDVYLYYCFFFKSFEIRFWFVSKLFVSTVKRVLGYFCLLGLRCLFFPVVKNYWYICFIKIKIKFNLLFDWFCIILINIIQEYNININHYFMVPH